MHDVYTAMPWSNTIDIVTISGNTLKKVLEHSVSQYDTNNKDPGGRFLQVSGLILTFDVRRPVNQRLVSAYAGHPSAQDSKQPIQDNKFYNIAVPRWDCALCAATFWKFSPLCRLIFKTLVA